MEIDFDDTIYKYQCSIPSRNMNEADDWMIEHYPYMFCVIRKRFWLAPGNPKLVDTKNGVYDMGFTTEEAMVACKLRFG